MKDIIGRAKIRQDVAFDLVHLQSNTPPEEHAREMAQRQASDLAYRQELQETSELLSDIEPLANSTVIQSIISAPVKASRKPLVAMAASVLIAVILGFTLYQGGVFQSEAEFTADRYVTRIGEQKEVVLSDGSTINLNTNSELLVTITEDYRQLTLKRGEVFFNVAKHPDLPFTVDTGPRTVTVLGTTFNILKEPGLLSVEVVEGLVAIHKPNEKVEASGIRSSGKKFNSYTQHRLGAGQAVAINTDDHTSILSTSDNVAGWRDGFLSFSRVPLYLVVKELNRYSPKKILIEDKSIIDLPVSATAKVNRINVILRGLELSQGIKVKHFVDRVVLISNEQRPAPHY